MALGSSGRRIVVEFVGDASSLKSGVRDGESALSSFSGKAQAAGKIAGKALAGGLLLAGAAAVKATQAAADDEAAQAKLATQLKKAAGASDEQIASTEDWITTQGLAKGVADDDLRPALAKLATATGDVDKAQRLAGLAMDISAGSGKSLDSVTTALAKAQTGSAASLSKFGITTKDSVKDTAALKAAQIAATGAQDSYSKAVKEHGKNSGEAKLAADKLSLAQQKLTDAQTKTKSSTIDAQTAIQRLADKYQGSAAKAADTTAGKQKILSVQFGELQEQIGAKLLPVMVKLADIGLKVVGWMSKNTQTAGIFLAVLGGLLLTVVAVGAATKVASAAQGLWSAATAVGSAVSAVLNSTFVLRLQLLALDAAAWIKSTASKIADTAATVAHTAAQVALTGAQKVAAVAQWALNAAMDANPIGLIVLAIAALAVGLVVAYKKSETFRDIVNGAFHAIGKVVEFVVGFVKDHWKLMLIALTGPFGIAVALITSHWTQIKAGAEIVIGWVRDHWPALKAMVTAPFDAAKTVIGNIWGDVKAGFGAVRDKLSDDVDKIKKAFSSAFDAVKSIIQGAIDKVQALFDKVGSLISKIGSLKDKAKSVATLGGLLGRSSASGGGIIDQTAGGSKEALAESRSMLGKVSSEAQKHLDKLKDKLNSLKDAMKSLRDSVSSSFSNDLFSATTGADFVANLSAKKGQLAQLSAAFKTLLGWGWKPQALASLFQSGNAGLILDLAANKDLATQGAGLYGDVTSMSDSLGGQVGQSIYGDQIDALTSQIKGGGKGDSGGSQRTYSMTVNVPPTADAAAVGREIVKTIRSLERAEGRQLLVARS